MRKVNLSHSNLDPMYFELAGHTSLEIHWNMVKDFYYSVSYKDLVDVNISVDYQHFLTLKQL